MADEIITKVSSCFTKAVDTGDVFFYPSTLHPHQDGPAEVVIFPWQYASLKPAISSLR